jgi:type II secretory pathway pseudopilin PulG
MNFKDKAHMKMNRLMHVSLKRQRGFGMLEVGLAFLIIAVAVIWAVYQYNSSRGDTKVQNEVSDITRLLAKTQNAYSSLPDYTGATTQVLINNNVFIPRWVNGARTAVVNNFNGAVTAAPGTLVNANDSIVYTSAGYDGNACADIPARMANATRRMDINGTTVKPDGGNVNPALVGTSCLVNANTITYYVGK